MDRVLVDTGVWYALFDKADGQANHPTTDSKAAQIQRLSVVVPWPTMYETLCTKFVKKHFALSQFERSLKSPNVVFVDDAPFRDAAFDQALESSLRGKRPLSMVDCLLRLVLDDRNTSIRYLATYNERDFVDVCKKRRVELL